MNWGKGIAIALTLFIGFILFLAISLMRTNFDLVSDDYYQREINYQDEIQAIQNANDLPDSINISITETHVLILLPQESEYKNIIVEFLRPNDKNLDQTFKIEETKTFTIEKEKFIPGKYDIRMSFSVDNKPCLQKEKIYI